ncbi:transposase [Streptomyces sp. G5(2025)]|uniref:transposase n=1 Tax=Streptomyces sp. G5(2025) TaxID=3406628 RepID=UPI003C15B116
MAGWARVTRIRVELFYLPPDSPELNDIELVWRQAKHEDYPRRTQTSTDSLGEAVDQAMAQQRDRIRGSTKRLPPNHLGVEPGGRDAELDCPAGRWRRRVGRGRPPLPTAPGPTTDRRTARSSNTSSTGPLQRVPGVVLAPGRRQMRGPDDYFGRQPSR